MVGMVKNVAVQYCICIYILLYTCQGWWSILYSSTLLYMNICLPVCMLGMVTL